MTEENKDFIFTFMLTFIGSGTLIATISFMRYLISVWILRRKESVRHAIESIHSLYETLNDVMAATHAVRAVIVKTENGGGIPHIGSRIYSTVLYEVHDKFVDAVKLNWQRRIVDEAMTKTLLKIVTADSTDIKLEELEGTLQLVYKTQGIAFSKVFQIYKDEVSFFYMSVNFRTNKDLTPFQMIALEDAVAKIRQKFAKIATVR